MGLIDEDTAYATEYGESFPRTDSPGIYATDIDTKKDASLDRQKNESVHKAKIADCELYDVAESEANRFIVRVVADVWISPLSKGGPTFYAKRKTKELLDQLKVVCMGCHTIDFLELQDKMQTLHVSTDTILQYIAELEKAQLQSARAEMTIPDNYLMMVATKAMLSSELFPWANEDWEDLENYSKSWTKWCKLYKKSDMKETIQIQAGGKEA